MTFIQWCERLSEHGMRVDGLPFTLRDRPALRQLYEAIPSTIEEAQRRTLVLMKGSQLGATIWEMLADLYLALKFEPLVVGMFLPDQSTAADKSERRFMRVVRSIPDIYKRLTTRASVGGEIKVGEGNILTRVMRESAFLFLWTTGKVTTESRPMDVLSLDEVQEMTLEQIDKTYERMSASRFRFRLMLSTANIPEMDIDFWFRQGKQYEWHSRCLACSAENDLSKHWPECCVYNEGQVRGCPLINEWVYICPDCGYWIEDTQVGRFIAANPTASIESFHLSQITSPTITPRDMAEAWNRAVTGDQRKTFYNRKLGRPYIDRDQLPVTMADCLACVADGVAMGLTWETSGRDCYMGIDQMGGFNAVIIKRRLPDGRQAIVHAEAVFDIDPFERCAELMDLFDVSICVVEQLPNVNDARKFANRFRGRVYLAHYATSFNSDMVAWGDQITRSDRKTAEEDRSRYMVLIQQYKAMQAALFRVRNRHALIPDPSLLEQQFLERGEYKRVNLMRDIVFSHWTKTALVVEQDEETRTPKAKVVKIGLDPHFSFAWMLSEVALMRVHGGSMAILPEAERKDGRPGQRLPLAENFARAMPGLPQPVLDMLDKGEREGTCGGCINFDPANNQCTLRLLQVSPAMTSCDLYDAKSHYRS
jgi:hypothetical protein